MSKKLKLVAKRSPEDKITVKIGNLEVGGAKFIVIAGPCSVEDEGQLIETARAVKRAGASMLRGGAFKPRTSPYSFQGLGEIGLKLLAKAREETGLPVVTEVMSVEQLDLVARFADVLQVGARNMYNYPLLKALGRIRKPVILKRGLSATIEEWLLSAEYIALGGNRNIILCERGIRTFEKATRNTLDLSAVPLIAKFSSLPIIVDPSHGTGIRYLVPPMARAAAAAGSDGIMVEVHVNPDKALSDASQSLSLDEFSKLMADLRPIVEASGRCL
ncbi:MAG TPA: 3-deoxy-7-phosphoheptulonate synthase [Candidatus Korarchaeota archaeon]|nr:3-deoxy-7-phosphoheptulonate synthase [Candidatus Korarchaeota archaeon]